MLAHDGQTVVFWLSEARSQDRKTTSVQGCGVLFVWANAGGCFVGVLGVVGVGRSVCRCERFAFHGCGTLTMEVETPTALVPAPQPLLRADVCVLVLGVVTLPHRVRRRRLMRETTFANASRAVVRFLLGRNTAAAPHEAAALESEQRRHGDLLILPGVEERGRRFKSMDCARKTHLFFRWCTEHFPGTQFCAKTEDDAFIHLPPLLVRLAQLPQGSMLLWGRLMWAASGCWGGEAGWPVQANESARLHRHLARCKRRWRTLSDARFPPSGARAQPIATSRRLACAAAPRGAVRRLSLCAGPYAREEMLKGSMALFASGPIDVRSRKLAAAIAECPWAREAEAAGERCGWPACRTVRNRGRLCAGRAQAAKTHVARPPMPTPAWQGSGTLNRPRAFPTRAMGSRDGSLWNATSTSMLRSPTRTRWAARGRAS